jgi:hypothetical protein
VRPGRRVNYLIKSPAVPGSDVLPLHLCMARGGVFAASWTARLAVVLAAAAVAAGLVGVTSFANTGGAAGEPAAAGFRLADGSIGCRVADGELACRSAGADAAAVLGADGASRVDDVAVAWDDSTPVLLAAESWWEGPFRCRDTGTRDTGAAVTCTAGDGAITVSTTGFGGVR